MLPNESGRKLHFLVSDKARELCRVTMPLASVENLEDLFPDLDRELVRQRGVDFRAVIARVLASEFAPQVLVDEQTSERSYRVWIE